jgi:putative FmdB family regulatory protein
MPLYEYECDACGRRFELLIQRFSDAPPETCPRCGSGPVRKLLSSPAIQFKGSGWYITDYARKDQKSGAQGDSGGSGDSAPKDKAAKETKETKDTKDTKGKGDSAGKAGTDSGTGKSAPPSSSGSSSTKDS